MCGGDRSLEKSTGYKYALWVGRYKGGVGEPILTQGITEDGSTAVIEEWRSGPGG